MRRGRSPSCATRWHGPEPPPMSCSGCSGTALRRQRPASGLQRRTPCPLYRHDDPGESFRSLDSLLREILRGLLPETAAGGPASVRTANSCEPNSPKVWAGHRPYSYSKPKKPFPPCSMRDALWPMLRTPSPPRWPRPSPESRCAKSPLRRACRNGMASTIWSPTPVRSAGQAALRSGALGVALFPLCGPALPGHLRLLYLRN